MTWLTRSRSRLPALAIIALGAVLSLAGVPVTSAQGTTVFPVRVDGALPLDAPFDARWEGVRPVEVTLSGQPVTPPMRVLPAFPSVRVRSLVNGDQIAVLMEWDDATRDESVLGVDRFADAAAIQFALGTGTSICMGQQAGGLNIWHWKADWALDLAGRLDVDDAHPGMPDDAHWGGTVDPADPALSEDGFFTGRAAGNPRSAATLKSSVEDLNAIGFGTLTPQPATGQNVHGASEYRDGVWRVVMSRTLAPGDANDASIRSGAAAGVIAFAVWDGSAGDRDGLKSVSAWLAFSLPSEPIGFLNAWPFLVMLVMALVASGLILWYGGRQPAVGLGWIGGRPEGPDGAAGGPEAH